MVIFCFAIRNNLGNDTNNRWKEYFRWKNFGTSLDLKKFNLWFIICLFAAIQTLFFVLCTIGLHFTLRLDTRCILILDPPTTLRRTRHCHVTVPKIIYTLVVGSTRRRIFFLFAAAYWAKGMKLSLWASIYFCMRGKTLSLHNTSYSSATVLWLIHGLHWETRHRDTMSGNYVATTETGYKNKKRNRRRRRSGGQLSSDREGVEEAKKEKEGVFLGTFPILVPAACVNCTFVSSSLCANATAALGRRLLRNLQNRWSAGTWINGNILRESSAAVGTSWSCTRDAVLNMSRVVVN